MFPQNEPDPPPSSRYPPTTAQWAVSPLVAQQAVERNPLEPAPPTIRPLARLLAVLIIGSGVLALVGLFLELSLPTVPMVFALVPAIGGIVEGGVLLFTTTLRATNRVIQFGVVGLAVQLLDGLLRLAGGIGQPSGRLELGYGITVASFLIMGVCGWLIKVTSKPPVTEQDIADVAREENIENRSRTRVRPADGDRHPGAPPPWLESSDVP